MLIGIIGLHKGRFWFRRDAGVNDKQLGRRCKDRQACCGTALTAHERQISCAIARGATNREIPDYLKIGQHIVKTHIYHIFQKIKVLNRLQAAIWASDNLMT